MATSERGAGRYRRLYFWILPVRDVQADEVWAFVQMKEKTKKRQDLNDETTGDAYTFTALDRDTKLILCWHPGRRTARDTRIFIEKLERATSTRFQLTTAASAATLMPFPTH